MICLCDIFITQPWCWEVFTMGKAREEGQSWDEGTASWKTGEKWICGFKGSQKMAVDSLAGIAI
jgi:hypothetical protein